MGVWARLEASRALAAAVPLELHERAELPRRGAPDPLHAQQILDLPEAAQEHGGC